MKLEVSVQGFGMVDNSMLFGFLSKGMRKSWILTLVVSAQSYAQTPPSPPDQTAVQVQRERAERQAQQRENERNAPGVRLEKPSVSDYHEHSLPLENPCFELTALVLEGPRKDDFGFVQRYLDSYAGRCVGQQGLRLISRRAADLILSKGYVTARVVIPEQSLKNGTLRLTLVPGTIGAIRFAPGSPTLNWQTAFPMRAGDLLNLRDIEQGLEQFKRVPSQDVKVDIMPGTNPDTSDLLISVTRTKRWRATVNLSDSGADSTGRAQGGVNLAIDQPFGLNDLFVVGFNHSVKNYRSGKGTRGINLNYSIPWGNWTFSVGSWSYGYTQPTSGGGGDFEFTGRTNTNSASATYMAHRDSHSKTMAQLTLFGYNAHSYINGEEIDVQYRKTRAAELALMHRRYIDQAQLDVRLAYRHGVPWLGGQWSAGAAGNPTNRYGLAILDASLNLPFHLADTPLLWTSEVHAQQTGSRLYVEDYLTIGGRYTVRGFDGNASLGGVQGAYWRNTLALPLGQTGQAVYGGVDIGRISSAQLNGSKTNRGAELTTSTLSGAAIGFRGGLGGFNWDLFAGWALQRPEGLPTRRPAAGFQMIYTF